MFDNVDVYPLTWPIGWPRTQGYRRLASPFKQERKHVEAADFVLHELSLLGARQPVISSNLKPRQDGRPLSGQGNPTDPGVAVYFVLKGEPRVLASDKWTRAVDNLYAIGLHIQALRGLERWGVGSVEQAFSGYPALPAEKSKWWEVLGVDQSVPREAAQAAYRQKAKQHHPDAGGSSEAFLKIQNAWEQASKERGWI